MKIVENVSRLYLTTAIFLQDSKEYLTRNKFDKKNGHHFIILIISNQVMISKHWIIWLIKFISSIYVNSQVVDIMEPCRNSFVSFRTAEN